jgi:glucan 1,3-beta-glucosidase
VLQAISHGRQADQLRAPYWKRDVAFDFSSQKVQGTNIGGWLVLEPWITPSIFQAQDGSVVDEYTLAQKVPDAADILRRHWDSFVSIADFQRIAGAGFNTVRIPIGYWAFEKYPGDPYIMGAQDYLDTAIEWARQTGLKVWIDLHGAPLSQNGFDNSGQRTSTPEWTSGDTAGFTNKVISQIAAKYAVGSYQDVVVAIQLLNEPLLSNIPNGRPAAQQYYRDGFYNVRQTSNTPVVFSDGFAPVQSWNGFLTPSDNNAQNVIVDHHEYQIFNNDFAAMSPAQHRQFVCDNVASYTENRDKWLVIGEWTAAMTDCAAALNGYGIGARYDGTFAGSTSRGSCANVNFIETWSQSFKDDMRRYVEAQLDVYELYSQGWIFWNFKTEASPEWDLFRLLDVGVFPQPLAERRFGKACSF